MDLTVIIVNWNVSNFLKKCLNSIYRFTQGVEFELWVVDNNSSDGSVGMVKAHFPGVQLIENHQNLGFAQANNLALSRCQGRYILLLNPDTELIENSFKLMVEFMDTQQKIDAIGCKLLGSDSTLQPSCRLFPSLFIDFIESLYLDGLFPNSSFFNRYRMAGWPHDDLRSVDQVYGACLLFRKEILESIGPLDERFFMYYEETDFCFRIKKNGGKIYFLPQIKLIHHSNKSSNQAAGQIDQWKIRSRLLFFRKRYGHCLSWLLFINLALRSVMVKIFTLTHFVCGRPRDIKYFKDTLYLLWSEYLSFFKNRSKLNEMGY